MTSNRARRLSLTGCMGRLPLLTAAALVALLLGAAQAAAAERLGAAVLTRDLGDPRAPGNLKLVVSLPDELYHHNAAASARDFSVYVYPEHLAEAEGTTPAHLADGVYLWRSGSNIFLDARLVPLQEAEGRAVVKVVYHPGGEVLAEGIAEGLVTYAIQLVDVVMAVDISSSMNHTDPRRRRVAAASTFIEMARRGGGIGRVGLITFNSRARMVTPLLPLSEGEILLDTLQRIGADGMTSIDAPLRLGMEELTAGEGSQRPVIILLTDGRNEGSRFRNTHVELAEKGIRVFTVGLTELADHNLLREIADVTGGLYFRAPTDEDLPEIYARLAAELGKRRMLQSDILRTERGRVRVPIDESVKRLVAIADGGARVGVTRPDNQGMYAGGRLSSVHMINPDPGMWGFAWEQASPDVSSLSLFGDTQFFLDVFPPQLRGTRLALGATLAEGTRPLAGGRVWTRAVPGIIDYPVEMYDDGRHGDGAAGDGVYGAMVDFYRDDVERFDMDFRATGTAWQKGEFIRQASGLALRSREPAGGGTAKLEGDLDFGVLFPGETGTALARIHLDTKGPRELDFDLFWDGAGGGWPDMSSRVTVQPGRRAFELEMTIPEDAAPGDYTGRFSVTDREDLGDSGAARVRVGSVRFARPAYIDLGAIPPGTFAARDIRLPYAADKAADLRVDSDGDGLSVTPGVDRLTAGEGEIPLEAVVTVPMGTPEGEYTGTLRLSAGPGSAEIPLRWRVKSYAASGPERLSPVSGVPALPEFPDEGDMAALSEPPPMNEMLFPPVPASSERMDDGGLPSPWEKASEAIREEPALPAMPLPDPADFDFTTRVEPKKQSGESFWSAWWMYLLAILLLLLLLLLLVVYILYRLGKSSLARLLLVAGLANLFLIAVFIALLGTSDAVGPESAPTVSVTLVEDDYRPVTDYLTDLEKEMLAAPSASAGDVASAEAAGGGGESAAEGQVSLDQPQSSGGGLVSERTVETSDSSPGQSETQLAMAHSPAAMPLENTNREPLNRRERRPDRSSLPEPMPNPPVESSEAPAESGEKAGEHVEVGETRLEIEANAESDRPVWSDGDRVAQPMAAREGILLAETTGMETVSLDAVARRVEPHGRRRNLREAPEVFPEPRVDIADPVRDAEDVSAPDAPDSREGEPGVEEIRSEPRSMGVRQSGSKPGALAAPGVSSLNRDIDSHAPRGISGDDGSAPALAQGGMRSARGGAGRSGAARTSPAGSMPGGLMDEQSDNRLQGGANNGAAGGGGSVGGGGDVGERRFDSRDGGGDGGGGGQPAGGGTARSPSMQGGGGGTGMGPSRLASGGGSGGEGDRVAFAPGGGGTGLDGGPGRNGGLGDGDGRFPGDGAGVGRGFPGGGGGNGDGRGRRQGPGRGAGGDMPGGLGGLPGGGDGSGKGTGDGGGDGAGSGRGRGAGGVGEGRFDNLPGLGGGSGLAQRGGAVSVGVGRSNLSGDDSGVGTGAVSMTDGGEDWFVARRREPRKHVTAASSSLEIDSLLIVVGDFARLPDPAAENLFAVLSERIGGGMSVEERRLAPDDANLSDTLLAVLSPEEARNWSDSDFARAGAYLAGGGHIWMDGARFEQADEFMRRLAKAAGGEYGPLPKSHQLSEYDQVGAITMGDKLAAVATAQDWRNSWRYGDKNNGPTLRFLIRGLNYFLSGNAESGIVLDSAELRGDLYVEPHSERIPESLSGGGAPEGRVWDAFEADTAGSWRMPAWSDPGEVSAISDGEGGRALKLDLAASEKGRAAVYRVLNPYQNFSGAERLTLDVYHDGDGEAAVSLALTVPVAGAWTDFETPPVRLNPGWNRVEFRLREPTFRSLANGGAFASALPGADRVGRAGFFLYRNGASPAIGMFRDIRLHER